MNEGIMRKAQQWTAAPFDENTRREIQDLIDRGDEKELFDRFYKELEFGTGGMRGIMGAGINRMNVYTVGAATQGFADYLLGSPAHAIKKRGIAIAYDSRNNSKLFAKEAASVLAGNGIKVYIFPELRPTPLLSFTVRHLNAAGGIVITASHNPKEYNGYKVYSDDGSQVIPPHDAEIVACVGKVDMGGGVNRVSYEEAQKKGLINELDETVENIYLQRVKGFTEKLERGIEDVITGLKKEIKAVYTPLHGTGITLVPRALAQTSGRSSVICEEAQSVPDGNFPTTPSPNPEERAALTRAIECAKKEGAEMVIATDPDCDRMGLAVPDENGEFVTLNGNQIGCLLACLIGTSYGASNSMPSSPAIISTIVSTELVHVICDDFGIYETDVLTGFKYIAAKMREFETEKSHNFIYAFEESYGYLADTFVRDKDGVIGSVLALTLVKYGIGAYGSVLKMLHEIYRKYGMYLEFQKSVTLKGVEGAEKIKALMAQLREHPPDSIAGEPVVHIRDYLRQKEFIASEEKENPMTGLPVSNVLQFYTSAIKISVRPSGTEPKIKFYFALKSDAADGIDQTRKRLVSRYDEVWRDMFARCGIK